ncbi:MAG: hypothetical protein EXQ67_04240 [Thermoleophilia bacterium]|nr:hypothetical protein [Thermoleophilia bacterium]
MQHVLHEVGAGRPPHDAMQDSYVAERVGTGSPDRVLNHPEETEAVGADIISEKRRLLDN